MWSSAINSAIEGPGNIWTQKKRFDSFAPERKHCSVTWLVTIKIQQLFLLMFISYFIYNSLHAML